jgi:Tol biopolymer transport system component
MTPSPQALVWRSFGVRRCLTGAMVVVIALALAGCDLQRTGARGDLDRFPISWAPDAKSLAWWSGGRLYVYDTKTQRSRLLKTIPDEFPAGAAWSPSGKEIAFYGWAWRVGGGVSLRLIDPESGQIGSLASDVWDLGLSTSSTQAQAPSQGTAEAEAQGGEQSADFLMPWDGGPTALSWSPDGKRIAFLTCHQNPTAISILDDAGNAVGHIEEDHIALMTPSWSPDGKRLAYAGIDMRAVSGPLGSLWLYDVGSKTRERICDLSSITNGAPPTWSADSTEIGFITVTESGDSATACIVKAKRGAKITNRITGITEDSTWAPGLKGLAFVEERGEGNHVLVYRGVRPVTRKVLGRIEVGAVKQNVARAAAGEYSSYCCDPAFTADGRQVAVGLVETIGKGPRRPRVSIVTFALNP